MFRTTVSRFTHLVRTFACSPALNSVKPYAPMTARLRLEAFEAREVPAAFVWRGALSTDAGDGHNWSGGSYLAVPGQYDTIEFTTQPS